MSALARCATYPDSVREDYNGIASARNRPAPIGAAGCVNATVRIPCARTSAFCAAVNRSGFRAEGVCGIVRLLFFLHPLEWLCGAERSRNGWECGGERCWKIWLFGTCSLAERVLGCCSFRRCSRCCRPRRSIRRALVRVRAMLPSPSIGASSGLPMGWASQP